MTLIRQYSQFTEVTKGTFEDSSSAAEAVKEKIILKNKTDIDLNDI